MNEIQRKLLGELVDYDNEHQPVGELGRLLRSAIIDLRRRSKLHEVACIRKETIVALGYNESEITEQVLHDMALNIDITQALESEIHRLADDYGLTKSN